jgi:hypothetical protein
MSVKNKKCGDNHLAGGCFSLFATSAFAQSGAGQPESVRAATGQCE